MKDVINSIIRFDLCPLIANNKNNDYYEPSYRQLGTITENFDANFKIEFNAPIFSSKVKYYKRLIDNTITRELNKILSTNYDDTHIAYLRKKKADIVNAFLIDIKDIIIKNNLDLYTIFTIHDYSQANNLNEHTYIFHYLILSLIRFYMEFQQHFINQIIPDKQLTINDFFVQTLQWKAPDIVGIVPIQKIEIPQKQETQQSIKNENYIFSFKYNGRNPSEKIQDFMSSLKRNEFIASETSIIDFKHLFSCLNRSSKPPKYVIQ